LKNVLHSKALSEDQVDEDLKRKNQEFLTAKKRKRDEEKQSEESKRTLLDKHNDKLSHENGL
jgi:hypothetical protein